MSTHNTQNSLEHTAPRTAPLTDRGLLLVTGENVREFLQGMVTCDMNKLDDSQALYGAHLTHQGRVLYDFFAFNWLHDGQHAVAFDCHKSTLMDFAKSLHEHKMRFSIGLEDLTEDYYIYADLSDTGAKPGVLTREENTLTFADPRLEQMGARHITPKKLQTAQTLEAYQTHRIKNAVPDPAYDGKPGKTIVSELCLEYLNGVDYKKGCYMGQEMTARTHFRSPPKKRVVALTYEGDAPAPGAKVKAGKLPVGEVFSCADGRGIGILRVAKALTGGAELTADGIPLKAEKPAWAEYDIV